MDGDARSIRTIRRDVDQVQTETLRWHPAGVAEPLVLDVAAMFGEALG